MRNSSLVVHLDAFNIIGPTGANTNTANPSTMLHLVRYAVVVVFENGTNSMQGQTSSTRGVP